LAFSGTGVLFSCHRPQAGFCALVLSMFGRRLSCGLGQEFSRFDCLELAPFIRLGGFAGGAEGQPKLIRRPEFPVAVTSALGDFDKAQRGQFSNGWPMACRCRPYSQN
jgi:hypothetical protein